MSKLLNLAKRLWQPVLKAFQWLSDKLMGGGADAAIEQSASSASGTTQRATRYGDFEVHRDLNIVNVNLYQSPQPRHTERSLLADEVQAEWIVRQMGILGQGDISEATGEMSPFELAAREVQQTLRSVQEADTGAGTADPRRLLQQPTSSSASGDVHIERGWKEEDQRDDDSEGQDESTPYQLGLWDG